MEATVNWPEALNNKPARVVLKIEETTPHNNNNNNNNNTLQQQKQKQIDNKGDAKLFLTIPMFMTSKDNKERYFSTNS